MKSVLRKSYDRDSPNYDAKFRHIQFEKYTSLIAPSSDFSPVHRALDLGCGTGLLGEYLRESNMHPGFMVGLDFSMGMISMARKRGGLPVQGDIGLLPFKDGVFDSVFAFTVLRIMPEYEDELGVLTEIHRVMKGGARLYVSLLRARADDSFVANAAQCGFSVGYTRDCGQDIGYICEKFKKNI